MAWYFGDETRMAERELEYKARHNNYNWGYDPQNYFSPDGAYSEKPEDPAVRIAEFKDLIAAIHAALAWGGSRRGLHTWPRRAFLTTSCPTITFSVTPMAAFSAISATISPPIARWLNACLSIQSPTGFEEFKIDGMRFDMMGDATTKRFRLRSMLRRPSIHRYCFWAKAGVPSKGIWKTRLWPEKEPTRTGWTNRQCRCFQRRIQKRTQIWLRL